MLRCALLVPNIQNGCSARACCLSLLRPASTNALSSWPIQFSRHTLSFVICARLNVYRCLEIEKKLIKLKMFFFTQTLEKIENEYPRSKNQTITQQYSWVMVVALCAMLQLPWLPRSYNNILQSLFGSFPAENVSGRIYILYIFSTRYTVFISILSVYLMNGSHIVVAMSSEMDKYEFLPKI